MKQNIERQLNDLETFDIRELERLWYRYFKHPPLRLRRGFLVSNIAYKMQEKKYGGLGKTIKNKLERLAFGEQQQSQPKYNLTAGMQLVREWSSTRYIVIVTENGFEYQDKHYRSLTKIACKITGTRWSGPLFFGLKT